MVVRNVFSHLAARLREDKKMSDGTVSTVTMQMLRLVSPVSFLSSCLNTENTRRLTLLSQEIMHQCKTSFR